MRPCVIAGCEKVHYARGWCEMHYKRWCVHGDPLTKRAASDSFLDHFVQGAPDECWPWQGSASPGGYGRLGARYAHRLSYEHFVGPFDAELHIDHLCRNRLCVNPRHLEPVTQGENNRRALLHVVRTTCKYGHPWVPDNILQQKSQRRCRECKRLQARRWRARRGVQDDQVQLPTRVNT